MIRRYTMAGQVLRLLADGEPIQLAGSDDPMRSVLRTAAEGCEEADEASLQLAQALTRLAELETVLADSAEVLEAEPLPAEGGSWAVMSVAEELRRALNQAKPDDATDASAAAGLDP